jgi:glutathione S-transferase
MNTIDQELVCMCKSIMLLLSGRMGENKFGEEQSKLNYIVSELKKHLESFNKHLEGKEYLVGSSITLADIQLAAYIRFPLSMAINPPFRNKILNFMNWYYRITGHEGHFDETFGKLKL